MRAALLSILMLLCGAPAFAQAVVQPLPPAPAPTVIQPAPGAALSPDGRYYGHLPYREVANDALAGIAQSLSPDKSCQLHRDAAASLYRLMGAAQGEGIRLRLISCFRTREHQQSLFCRPDLFGACRDPAERARSVAPGGYSEHITGYTIDFGTDYSCDLSPCMAATPGGQWLLAKAPKFGFELSFPPANRQGVTWEPWHWRWVGTSASEPGAAAARAVFARARAEFPARPAVTDQPAAPVKLRPVDRNRFIGPRD
jgi:D-alanyl-D-alanine carboxypeptidase